MGEARKRGTKAQRVAEGIAKRQAAEAKRDAEWREYQRSPQYERGRKAMAMVSLFAALVDGGAKG